ncbi:hypothetical protein ISN45_Aa07g030340 [Arabidopsis thaliana x Arabidopsis arenosa]|uniref:Uncharacterized protein n=1 Tax=Arabidopsis thaliana x Arabidopsis arenosa TaxID=1240361 RepID=A0A8T1Y7J0_9BRAS|nr:hypothetical protein ISN45_Aa07g030340 [Arabidopsis thaliana x Arabidopsis arenosa]
MTPDQIIHVTCSKGLTLEPKDKNSLKNLLMGICNIKILYLSCDTLKELNDYSETIPVFNNLMQLTIVPCVEYESLRGLLKNCPNLETLVFEGLHHESTKRCDDEDKCLCEYTDDCGGEDRAGQALPKDHVES